VFGLNRAKQAYLAVIGGTRERIVLAPAATEHGRLAALSLARQL
jgi:hypothetical protein